MLRQANYNLQADWSMCQRKEQVYISQTGNQEPMYFWGVNKNVSPQWGHRLTITERLLMVRHGIAAPLPDHPPLDFGGLCSSLRVLTIQGNKVPTQDSKEQNLFRPSQAQSSADSSLLPRALQSFSLSCHRALPPRAFSPEPQLIQSH